MCLRMWRIQDSTLTSQTDVRSSGTSETLTWFALWSLTIRWHYIVSTGPWIQYSAAQRIFFLALKFWFQNHLLRFFVHVHRENSSSAIGTVLSAVVELLKFCFIILFVCWFCPCMFRVQHFTATLKRLTSTPPDLL